MNFKKLFFLGCNLCGIAAFAQVGINTATPNAQLDIRATSATTPSNTDGLLIPKINVFPAINPTAAQQGMLVYLTTAVGTKQPGFYYWNNPTAAWIGLGADVKAWQLVGNIVNATTDFMGSVNNADVIFKRNNVRAGRLGVDNTSFGADALNPLTTGLYNTASGVSSLKSNTSGTWNTSFGYESLLDNTTGWANIAFGPRSLQNNTTGGWNSAMGTASMDLNTAGNYNAALGMYSLQNNTTGSNNTATGYSALANNVTGSNNTGIGKTAQTGTNLTNATAIGANASATTSNSLVLGSINGTNGATASVNVGIGTTAPADRLHVVGNIRMVDGNQAAGKVLTSDANGTATWQTPTVTGNSWALAGNTINAATDFMGSTNNADVIFKRNNVRAGRLGVDNISFGVNALNSLTTGINNVSFGRETLLLNSTGMANSAFGNYTLSKNINGSHNVAYGGGALQDHTTGDYNTAIGRGALIFSTSGSNNTAVGYYALSNNSGFSNSTALGANTVISASNQVRLGNNAVTSIGGQVAWTTLSDARFKTENSKKVPGIDFIKKLRPVTYYVNHEAMNAFLEVPKGKDVVDRTSANSQNPYKPEYVKSLESGFMAQEVEQAAKELGYDFNGVDAPKNDKDYYGLRYSQFVVPLVKAVQELDEKLQQKEAENQRLKQLLLGLESRILKLENKN